MTTHRSMVGMFILMSACAVACEVIGRRLGISGPWWALFDTNDYVLCAVYTVPLLHLFSTDDSLERLVLIVLGLALVAMAQMTPLGFFRTYPSRAGYALGLASTLTFIFMWRTKRRSFTETAVKAIYCWAILLAIAISTFFVNLSERFNPVLDPYLYHFEEGLGIRIESLATAAVAFPGGRATLYVIYAIVPLVMAVYFIFEKTPTSPVPLLFLMTGAIGICLYRLYPVVGPGVAYPSFYQSMWPIDRPEAAGALTLVLPAFAGRNTMPSLHMVAGCFLLWNRGRFPAYIRWMLVAFAAMTVPAALVVGKHWFIDLVVALPLAAAMQRLAEQPLSRIDGARMTAIITTVALVVFWFVALRDQWFTLYSPGWARWAAIVVTLAGSTMALAPSLGSTLACVTARNDG